MSKTWKEVIESNPGPRNKKEAMILGLKGLLMGAADIVPGVSGGTIAFITGIYEKLLLSIKSVNQIFLQKLFRLQIKDAFSEVHLRFLLPLLSGIAISIVALSGLMNYLINDQPVYTWSVFFGLIVASIVLIGKKIENIFGRGGAGFLLGAILGYFLVALIPVQTPEAWWFIMLSGMIAISAMILPGLSGSFILLILGKYEFMTGALKNPFAENNIFIILIFITGCALGVIIFSRILSCLFEKYHNFTLALMAGLITGSLRKIWPFKEVLETKMIGDHEMILAEKNIFPEFGPELYISVVLMITAFVIITLIEKKAK